VSTGTLDRIDAATGLEILETVNLGIDPACESKSHPVGRWGHTGPAELVIRIGYCSNCHDGAGNKTLLLFCRGGWDYAFKVGLRCRRCDTHYARDDIWTLVTVL
jgi:hypothetical protein